MYNIKQSIEKPVYFILPNYIDADAHEICVATNLIGTANEN